MGSYSLSLQDPHFSPDPWEYIFSLDLWSLNSFVHMQSAIHAPKPHPLSMRCRILLQPRPEFGGGKWQHSNCATRTQSEAHGRNIPQNMSTYMWLHCKINQPSRTCYWNMVLIRTGLRTGTLRRKPVGLGTIPASICSRKPYM